ncbi:hypothetical protein [Rhodococcus triatomae]|nr:hypothetical protein G419_23604 [Rhodococcus triatomae BKS 15-14]
MDLVEYVFGTGDGDPSLWLSPADLDLGAPGGPDAVTLDFDGDGWRDDALWDGDGDGRAEMSVLDVDSAEASWFTDPEGLGTWAVEVSAPGVSARTAPEAIVSDPPAGPGTSENVDFAGDGTVDDTAVDLDGDGAPDVVVVPRGSVTELFVDSDEDGSMDVRLVDTDGDGRVDSVAESVVD